MSKKGYTPRGRRIWILFQDVNGDSTTKRYCYWFDSRQAAREHKQHIESNIRSGSQWCPVYGPYAYDAVRRAR